MNRFMGMAWLLAALLVAAPAAAVNIDAFVERAAFDDIKISPNGDYLAATVPLEDRTVLVFLKRADNSVHGSFNLGRNKHVAGFWWVTDERVVISGAEKIGAHNQPRATGDLFAVDADGKNASFVAGQSGSAPRIATRARSRDSGAVAAHFIARLPDSPREVLISVSDFSDDAFTFAERVNILDGRRVRVARAPVRRGTFVADSAGEVRAVVGAGIDNVSKLYLRLGRGDEWKLINDQGSSERVEWPLGFSADGARLYLQATRDTGPDAIVAYDVATGARTDVIVDSERDPEHIIYNIETREPVGAQFLDGKARTAFIDPKSPEARQQRGLEAAFPGQTPVITSHTRDGRFTLVEVSSDRNPGDFYLFDTVNKSAKYVISRRASIDPDAMAEARPIAFQARDGLKITGYLTLPPGSAGKALPMVVLPHGGPFGVQEDWHFDDDSQLLALDGYAVLRVDFRGSGGRGRAFQEAGAREWGGKMQDDVTDATRWAIQQGIADASRICIYGASYGGYAALMGVAKEPALYRCAIGYIGVYDLPLMHVQGDVQERGSGETYLREWIGERAALAAVSPNLLADRIRVPVMLAAGGEDQRAPIEHSRRMEKALAKAGVPVETLYYKTEGHGFYVTEHRKEFYRRMLAFLGRHLAPGAGAAPVASAAASADLDLEQGTP
jgi:dipeptidyl aminopeptidase/acylaminoacyl peptidase